MDVATRRGRPTTPRVLSREEREVLERWARRGATAQSLALRTRIILACAEGKANQAVANEVGTSPQTVCKWRGRFIRARLKGLADEYRSGALVLGPPSQTPEWGSKPPLGRHRPRWRSTAAARASAPS